jgi:hypothetical protein
LHLPREILIDPSSLFPSLGQIFLIACITYDLSSLSLLQALFSDTKIPRADNSITRSSLEIPFIEIFILLGNLFSLSPLIIILYSHIPFYI